jgi:hypothetical protein
MASLWAQPMADSQSTNCFIFFPFAASNHVSPDLSSCSSCLGHLAQHDLKTLGLPPASPFLSYSFCGYNLTFQFKYNLYAKNVCLFKTYLINPDNARAFSPSTGMQDQRISMKSSSTWSQIKLLTSQGYILRHCLKTTITTHNSRRRQLTFERYSWV